MKYTAGVSIFSGRPDPTWPVNKEVADDLQKICDGLERYSGSQPAAPPLGYRGVFLRNDAGDEWSAYKGVIVFRGGNSVETRVDPDRTFERTIIDSAPEGLIPPALVSGEFK